VDRRLAQMSWDLTWAGMDGQIDAALRAATRQHAPAEIATLRRAGYV
jgi:hypothetical protein